MTPYEQEQTGISRKATIVCVTNQFECERIIKAGRVVADLSNTDLKVINVSPSDFNSQNTDAIEHLYMVSQQNGAEMTVIYSDEALRTLISFIKQNKAVNVLTGMPQQNNSILQKLWMKFTHISFFTVEKNGELHPVVDKSQSEIA